MANSLKKKSTKKLADESTHIVRMDGSGNAAQEVPPQCVAGCGFYGLVKLILSMTFIIIIFTDKLLLCRNAANLNMCSKCYSEHQKRQEKAATPAPSSISANSEGGLLGAVDSRSNATSASSVESETSVAPFHPQFLSADLPQQINTSRCFSCNKKIGLTGFKCRCSYVFCSEHRYR